jgi:hypothetical protein
MVQNAKIQKKLWKKEFKCSYCKATFKLFFSTFIDFFDAFSYSTFNFKQICTILLVCYFLLFEYSPKSPNCSKFTKEQDNFGFWIIDGKHHQKNKKNID